jgi:anti-sigma regulatory factor (Ser/Thr protein kinase)
MTPSQQVSRSDVEHAAKSPTPTSGHTAASELVRIGQLSEILGVAPWTLRRYANSGRIPVVRSEGQQRRFDPSLVRAALADIDSADFDSDADAGAGDASRPDQPRSAEHPLDKLIETGPETRPAHTGPVETGPVAGEITPASTEPSTPPTWQRAYQLDGLEEHLVWRDASAGAGIDTGTPASRLIEYSLEEMVNNAVDHSGGTRVTVCVWLTPDLLAFQVADDGEGAFAHLRKGLGLEDDFDAITALTKGKQTTWKEKHTGEGIFFTSKMNDIFKMTANGKTWTVDNPREDQSVGMTGDTVGTTVYGQVDPHTTRTSSEVFAQFIDDDYSFTRTKPSVKLAALGLRFASRSEARRLMAGLGEFTEIDVDFAGVTEVGQGFIDEIFRVWAQNNPDKTLNPINMNRAVEFMVRRGLTRT